MLHRETTIQKLDKKVWLSSPTMYPDSMKYVMEAYETNWMSTVGANIDEIERLISEKVGCKYAVALGSGTSAIHLAVRLAGIKPGEHVLCSDMTFSATVNPVVYEGGVPVFVDEERDTWNMDPVALENLFQLYPDARLVIIVHLYGTPGKLDELKAVCKRHNATLLEDAAESLGATYKGIQTGSFGEFNAISFNGNKIITGSSGGMFLTNNAEAAARVRKWSTQSRERAPWYQHEEIGFNYRMSNLIAGVVRGQLPHLEDHIAQKKAIYERYKAGFAGLPVTMNPIDFNNSEPNYWLSCILINRKAMCHQERTDTEVTYTPEHGKSCPTEILDAITAINAEGRPIWKPMHMQPIYKDNPFVTRHGAAMAKLNAMLGNSNDVGADIFDRGLCLPSDNKMTPDQQEKIISVIRACFD